MARVSGDLIGGHLGSVDGLIGLNQSTDGLAPPLNGNGLELQNLMAPTPLNDQTTESENRYWVEKSSDGETLGKALLKRHFGFDDRDVAAYEAKHGKFIINDKQDCANPKLKDCSPATKEDIAGWMTKNGEVAIDLRPETVKRLRDFRNGRLIDAATEKIKDPFLKKEVSADLKTLTTGTPQERTEAAQRLANSEADTFDDAMTVRGAIRSAADHKINRQNATLQVLSAKVDLDIALADKHKALQGKINEYERRLQNAADAAGGIDTTTGKRLSYAKIDRAEAARVNQELSEIYEQMNQPEKALERRMVARYYTLTDKDRNSQNFIMGKPRVDLFGTIKPGIRSGFISRYQSDEMKAGEGDTPRPISPQAPPTRKDPAEDPRKMEIREYEKKFTIVTRTFDRGEMKVSNSEYSVKRYEQTYQFEGSLRLEDGRAVQKREVLSNGKRERVRIERDSQVTELGRGPELNATGMRGEGPTGRDSRRGMGWAKAANGAGEAINIFNNNFPLFVDVLFTDKSRTNILKRERLDRAIFLRDNYPIPPEPKDLPRIKLRLEKDFGKQKAAEMMKTIEEVSYATWGNR